jgi:hypothetical protein
MLAVHEEVMVFVKKGLRQGDQGLPLLACQLVDGISLLLIEFIDSFFILTRPV